MSRKTMSVPKFVVHQEYLTRGGWKAICIWVNMKGEGWFVHKPGLDGESHPILHMPNGRAVEIFTIVPLPSYDAHPADIIDVWREEKPVNDDETEADIGGR
jgi:hypothetical protein